MLSFLIRLLIFLSTIFLLGRFLRRFFPGLSSRVPPTAGAGRNSKVREMVKDPVCGMYMDPRLAVRMDYKQEELFFCSNDCRQKFIAKAS